MPGLVISFLAKVVQSRKKKKIAKMKNLHFQELLSSTKTY